MFFTFHKLRIIKNSHFTDNKYSYNNHLKVFSKPKYFKNKKTSSGNCFGIFIWNNLAGKVPGEH